MLPAPGVRRGAEFIPPRISLKIHRVATFLALQSLVSVLMSDVAFGRPRRFRPAPSELRPVA